MYRGRGRGRTGVVVGAVCGLAALMALPEVASAVLSGNNGRIAFVSGRGNPPDNNQAKVYLRPTTGSLGFNPIPGALAPVDTTAGQHRHPTWSPDRTRIAYARGGEIFIFDLTTPGATPVNITNTALNEDRPAWSPDGTRIAFDKEASAGGQRDIVIKSQPFTDGVPPLNVNGASADTEAHPAWSPDSQAIYYGRGNLAVAPGANENQSVNIYKQQPPNITGAPQLAVANVANFHHRQPSISPDGNRICYTRAISAFDNAARVYVADLTTPPTVGTEVGTDPGSFNCTWSPNGTQVVYTVGLANAGVLKMRSLIDNPPFPVDLEDSSGWHGNPEWAPDGPPKCEDQTVSTTVNTPVQIPLLCDDTGPQYERSNVRALAGDGSNGTVSPDQAQQVPVNATYTPNQGFSGTDTFTISTFDQFGFGEGATVTVNVQAGPGGGGVDNDFSFGKVKKNKKKGTAKLTVNVPGPGDLDLAKTKKVKPADKRAPSQGSVKLKVKPKGKAKKKLADKGKAKVKAEVTYTPDGGDPNTKSKKVKLAKKR